jgi:hypothetical protein
MSSSSEEPPISYDELRDLFDALNVPNPPPCDHTHRLTREFLVSRQLPVETTIQWLCDKGGYCDCEVIFNVTNEWAEKVSWFPEDEDA